MLAGTLFCGSTMPLTLIRSFVCSSCRSCICTFVCSIVCSFFVSTKIHTFTTNFSDVNDLSKFCIFENVKL